MHDDVIILLLLPLHVVLVDERVLVRAASVEALPPDRPLRVVHDGTTDRRTICPYCCDPLHYDDDRSHGFHTSRTKCVAEHKKNVA